MSINTNAWNRLRYDLYAPFYDAVVSRPFAGPRKQSIEALGLSGGERVLVVGCGTGLDFAYLPRGVRLTAGDISTAMVNRAMARAKELGFSEADVRPLDAHRLGLPNGDVRRRRAPPAPGRRPRSSRGDSGSRSGAQAGRAGGDLRQVSPRQCPALARSEGGRGDHDCAGDGPQPPARPATV